MRRIPIGLVCTAAAVAVAACGEQEAPRAEQPVVTAGERGVSVELPAGWQKAPATLTPELFDPREVISIGTFPMSYRKGECAQMPSSAIAEIGPRDAFLTLQERGTDPGSKWEGFPPRPKHFGPAAEESVDLECVPADQLDNTWFGMSDAGRHFHVLVSFGKDAPDDLRRQTWSILDSLRVDPDVKPDWTSSP